jgi:O-antigen/teichoic acid export membrane protein
MPEGTRVYLPWMRALASVLGARVFAAGTAFLANALVARHLGPADFNSFYLLFAIMSIVAGLTGPAIDTSLVRFAVKQIMPESDASGPYFKFVLYLKGVVLILTMAGGLVFAGPLYRLLFTGSGAAYISTAAILLAFFGGVVVSLWGFAQAYFQAHQRFTHFAGYEFFSSLLRLGLVLGLIGFDVRSTLPFLAMYVLAPLVMGVMSWSQLPAALYHSPTSLQVGKEFFQFAKWVLLATLFTTFTQRLDLLLLNAEVYGIPKASIGHYSAAVSLVLAGELVLLTFYSVLLPKASSLKSAGELRAFIGQFRVPSLLFCLATSLMIPLAGPFRQMAFGAAYAGTEGYFTILLLGVIAAIATAPTVTALYSLGHSRTIALLEVAKLVLTLGLGLYIIPRHGIYGMAWVSAGVRGGISIITYGVAHQTVKRQMIRDYRREEP